MIDETMQKKFTEAMSAFTEHKATVEEKFKKLDALDVAKLEKTGKAIEDAIEESQKMAGQLKALEEKNQKLEAVLSRPGFGKTQKEELLEKEAEQKSLYTEAFNDFFRNGQKNEDFSDFLARKEHSGKPEYKTLRVGTDADGGFLVTPVISDLIVTRQFETSPIRQIASQITISSDSYEVLTDYDQATSGGWVGEVSTRTTTNTPQVGKIIIPTHEQYAQPAATQKILDDAKIDAESWIAGKGLDIITRTENTAFVAGNGSSKPKGFLAYTAWASAGVYENDKIEQVNSGAAAALTYEGLSDLQNSLKEYYQANAQFLMKRTTFGATRKIVDGEGRPIFNLMYDKNSGIAASILNAPVKFADDMEAVAANALAVAYGDFKQGYQIVDRMGLRVLRDPFTSKPYVLFYMTKRTGGAVINFEAIKIQKVSA